MAVKSNVSVKRPQSQPRQLRDRPPRPREVCENVLFRSYKDQVFSNHFFIIKLFTEEITTPKPVVTTTATRRTTPPHTYLPPTTTKGVTTTTVDPVWYLLCWHYRSRAQNHRLDICHRRKILNIQLFFFTHFRSRFQTWNLESEWFY